jgi:hypothetical protein
MRGDEPVFDRDAIDERIDRALRSYAEPPELPETRVVLARVMERAREAESRRHGWWVWGTAVAAGLAVMVAVGVVWMMRSPRRAEIALAPRAPQVAPLHGRDDNEQNIPRRLKPESSSGSHGTAQAVALQNGGRHVDLARAEAPNPLPKEEVFPAPRPLSEQEEALVAFAHHVPATVQEQVIEAQKHVGDPIVIAELKIAPLEIGGGEQDSKQQEKDKER